MNHVPEVDSIGTRAPVGHSVSGNKRGGGGAGAGAGRKWDRDTPE